MSLMSHEPGYSHENMEAGPHVVEFAALDFVFAGPSEIPSGWTTFRMPNRGEEHHVMILVQLPEGVSYADFYAAYNQRSARPDWWDEQVIMGGPAALAPGLTGETTVKLDPGITMTLRGLEFEMNGVITPGRHTIRVVFEHQPEGKPHDVHVARLGPNQTVQDFATAMETLDLTDVYFIGGAEDMPEGYTAYFTADFEPGRYAFWCHYHSEDGMVQEFTVEPL
jgi:plastocyanin